MFVICNQASCNNCKILEENFAKYDENLGTDWLFYRANCLFHVSKNTHCSFEIQNVATLHWRNYPFDLNIIQNILSILASNVHANEAKFNCLHGLKLTV